MYAVAFTSSEMYPLVRIVCVAFATAVALVHGSADDASKAELYQRDQMIGTLARQVMLQQLYVEERTRSEGDSGIKQVRHRTEGTKSYFSEAWAGNSVASIHDHANNIRTVGMGEFIAVLNGVEFRTRHNDYRLNMPHRISSSYDDTEEIPFPNVPPEVSGTVEEQIVEMREWFRAWKEQDHTVRDYRPYFKPVLCYLEGAWTNADKEIDEPFNSDRHSIDASSWFDLQEKIRFTAATGRKSNGENLAYLPTTIVEVVNGTTPVFAQWNYKILCQPLKDDLPLNRLRVVDDLGNRISKNRNIHLHEKSRAARFQIAPTDEPWGTSEQTQERGLLDELMEQIPGKDNGPANLRDESFNVPIYPLEYPEGTGKPLNAGYYHRWFKVLKEGAMGLQVRHRGFADENMWAALNSREKIASHSIRDCWRKNGLHCATWKQRWSYAIPLEIIYMTPLLSWNPYNLEYKGEESSTPGKTVFKNADGTFRNGRKFANNAYNGTNSKKYYQTPEEFYTGNEVSTDAADTSRNGVGVLDRKGNVRVVRASGTRIFLPPIPTLGDPIRTRYPIMPIHAQGNSIWKELEALKDIVMEQSKDSYLIRDQNTATGSSFAKMYRTSISNLSSADEHYHTFELTNAQIASIKNGEIIRVVTSQENGHQHQLSVRWDSAGEYLYYGGCDHSPSGLCWDKHWKRIYDTDA